MKLVLTSKGLTDDFFAEIKDDLMRENVKAAYEWYIANVKKSLLVEQTFYNDLLWFAGTPDLVCELNTGEIVLIDWKTGSVINKFRNRMQTAAYQHLIESNTEIRINQRMILQVRGGKVKERKIKTAFISDFALFKYICKLNEAINGK